MNRRFCLLAVILVSLLTSCMSSCSKDNGSENTEEVVFDDGIKAAAENEIIITDNDLKDDTAVLTSGKSAGQITKIAADGSQINTMFDRYGNKTETRYFNYNLRLKFILLRTSGDGQKQVFIYGQNGEVKSLPENMLDKVLTAPANEIAAAAGINEIRTSQSTVNLTMNKPLTPLPGSAFPVRTPQPPAAPSETPEPKDAEPTPSAVPTPDENPLATLLEL